MKCYEYVPIHDATKLDKIRRMIPTTYDIMQIQVFYEILVTWDTDPVYFEIK